MIKKIDEMLKLGGAIEFGEHKLTHSDGLYHRWDVRNFIGELHIETFDNLEDAINAIY